MSDETQVFIGKMANIAYQAHDAEGLDPILREMLLDLWRTFNHYIVDKEEDFQ